MMMMIQNGSPSLWLPVTTGGFLAPPPLPPPPVPLIFQASEVKREAPDTCNGGRRTKKISLKKAKRKRKVLRQ